MTRRARITWLVDSTNPTGRIVMSLRQMQVLAADHDVAGLALTPPAAGAERTRLVRAFPPARSLAGEARLARSDVIVTVGDRTAASAVARLAPGTRVVHTVHVNASTALSGNRFMQAAPRIAGAIVPLAIDPADFARRSGIPAERVTAMDDFVPETESLLATGRSRWIVVAGTVTPATRQIVEAFALARPELPGWRLRVLGGGAEFAALSERVEELGLRERVVLVREAADIAPHYADAGLVVAINPAEANGLSVIEGLAAGVPVVGSPLVPAVGRLVRDGHNGVLLPRTDAVTIAETFVGLAADDRRRAALAAGARNDRAGLLTPAGAAQLRAYFAQILAQSRSVGGKS